MAQFMYFNFSTTTTRGKEKKKSRYPVNYCYDDAGATTTTKLPIFMSVRS